MIVINRPVRIDSDESALDVEFRSARWTYHRLLDFEDEHKAHLDRVADEIAPGILRVGRILARLRRRARRAERSPAGTWSPNPRADLASRLHARLGAMRAARNADPRWTAALAWADEPVGDAKAPRRRRAKNPRHVKRRKNESDDAFARRFALLTTDEPEDHYQAKIANPRRDSRRDQYRKRLYTQSRVYWGTWNGLLRAVDQARKSVLEQRKHGMPAEWRRPRHDDPGTLYADRGGFRIVEQSARWWVIEMRLGPDDTWARVAAHSSGKWPALPDGTRFVTAQLTRRRVGLRWAYSVSLTADADKDTSRYSVSGVVALDWGHREHGHGGAPQGLRVFTWRGDDGATGEVLLPRECRDALDEVDALCSRMDTTFDARKASLALPEKNRHTYRRRLMLSGVRTAEETMWLRWERRYERMAEARRRRVISLRKDAYLRAVRELRARYATFIFEGESVARMKRTAKDEMIDRRKRSNRDLSARYEFVSICERFGAALITVPARNSTRECPSCGFTGENGPELLYACPGCGLVRDKDHGAARVILARGKEALANRDAAE